MSSEFSQYTTRHIGWAEGAQGPDTYDCMSFNRMIQRKHFGLSLPVVTVPDYEDHMALVGLMNGHGERENWEKTKQPQHGDMVLVHRPMHYGVWINVDGGGVLHCVRGVGVCFTKDSSWHVSGFGRREYFRHKSKA